MLLSIFLAVAISATTLQSDLQDLLTNLSASSGYAMQLGFKNKAEEFSVAAGAIGEKKVTTSDTFLFGSGTKPFTASAIMKHVEKGTIKLTDPVAGYVDPVLQKMPVNGTVVTFTGLYGSKAANVTVGMLLTMQAGIPDYEQDPSFDAEFLKPPASQELHSPIEVLVYASTQPWACDPGTCVSYSSTNYVIAGLVLVSLAGPDATWETYDMKQDLLGGSR
jgi:D-alanyl-D-alanine carboxypeptidase